MKGYKVFNSDFTCRGFQYEIGKTYELEGNLRICQEGFHFCTNPSDCFNYYNFDSNNKVAEVEALGEVVKDDEDTKCATDKILIVREIDWYEVLDLVNTGTDNTGLCNSGDRNSGDRNSGDRNSGNRNSGNRNSGDWNSGDWNSGDRNSGDWNSGNWNNGNRNSGNWNSGNWNSGNRNSGDRNSGDWNSGDRNSGDWNSGDWNSGDRNSGNWNSGNRNSGDRNSGDWNSGDFNSCNYSAGVFCTEAPKLLMFDKPTEITLGDWRNSEPAFILKKFTLTKWISEENMTEEKEEHEDYETTEGYLRVFSYKEAWRNLWNSLNVEEKDIIKRLPNFDADKFEHITGIRVN